MAQVYFLIGGDEYQSNAGKNQRTTPIYRYYLIFSPRSKIERVGPRAERLPSRIPGSKGLISHSGGREKKSSSRLTLDRKLQLVQKRDRRNTGAGRLNKYLVEWKPNKNVGTGEARPPLPPPPCRQPFGHRRDVVAGQRLANGRKVDNQSWISFLAWPPPTRITASGN